MTAPIIETAGVRFAYGREDVLRGIDLTVGGGEFVSIIGPNGSGKTTLVRILAGYLRADEGIVRLCGRPLTEYRRREIARTMALVPQSVEFYFPYTVWDFVMMGRHPYRGWAALPDSADRGAVRRALDETGTARFAKRSILGLSGGERQRVVLAAALAQETDLLLLDEPTAALDLHYQVEILSILRHLNAQRNLTVVSVTHDLNLASLFSDRLVLLVDGAVADDGPPSRIVTAESIARHYGVDVTCGTHPGTDTPYVIPNKTGARE